MSKARHAAVVAVRLGLVVAVVLAIATVGLLAAVVGPPLPQRSGEIRLPGLERTVSVVRDAAAIAHITAETPHDLFMAQGYVHAQERMWQMEIWRRIGAGRLAELVGEGGLDADRFVRTLEWRGAAARDLANLSADARAALDAYAGGVNAYLADHRGRLGVPFAVVGAFNSGFEPEPWTPLDSMTFQKLQAWQLGGNIGAEIFRLLADEQLGDPARTDDLFPAYADDAPVITPTDLLEGNRRSAVAGSSLAAGRSRIAELAGRVEGWRRLAAVSDAVLAHAGLGGRDRLADVGGVGSNNWVIAPDRSATGAALLANDPHLGIGMPSVWYINALHCRQVSNDCPYDVAGVTFPSVPGVVLGHNARIAWGATNVEPDVQDLFVETVDPANEASYLFRGASRPFEVRREEIQVAGGETDVLEIRSTHHGPIITDVEPSLKDGPPVALRWTAAAEPDGAFEAIFRVNTAANFDEFREAFRGFGSPSQNFVFADVEGHIGYVLPGVIPIRSGGGGARPVDGASGDHEWTGAIPFDELPWQFDPPAGVIVTANNAPVDERYPHHIGADWDRGDRAARIVSLLGEMAADGISVDEMRAIQLDTLVGRSSRIVPLLTGAEPTTPDGRLILDRIIGWDGRATTDSAGAAAYLSFELTVLRRIFDDELGLVARDWVGTGFSFDRLALLLDEPASAWWDDVTTPEREDRDRIVAEALDRTGTQLRAALGEPERWTWGRLHTATFRDATLGASGIGPLEWLLNRGPVSVDGAAGAVNNTYYDVSDAYADPTDVEFRPVGIERVFEVSVGPSYRLLIDMADLDAARIIQTTGQSGHPFDRHHGDLVEVWRSGQTVPLPFSPAAIEAGARETLRLVP